MVGFFEIFSPSFLLFPALLGSVILAFVCPLVGAHLMLRRRVFLGLTLPQIAACGVAFTFWIYHSMGYAHGSGGERLLAMAGSLALTLVGMGMLAYLDRHASGTPEGRLAAAYALASALTILFIVFNPQGELEILNLLKGEVITLSSGELKLLALIYGIVYLCLVLFRREFLLNSFDRDLSFLLTGGSTQWNFWLYVLCGFCIAIGVIMAGPMLIFGFMVLPPLAARALARGMNRFFTLSCLIGVFVAVVGFYLSVRLDLPLGPTNVAFGCVLIFVIYGVQVMIRKFRGGVVSLLFGFVFVGGCATQSSQHSLDWQSLRQSPVWLASVRNATPSDLRLPSTNPLRSIAEWAGKVSPDYRPTVPDILRGTLRKELEQRKVTVSLPEERDMRMQSFPFDASSAAANARSTDLSGWLLLSEIRRWQTDGRSPLRALVEFKLVRIDNGAVAWERQVSKTVPIAGSGRLDEVTTDGVREILRDVLGGS
ncbi:MAG: metal ABC transporter permease [Deltaproteobacteria bacterium]|nr:metal ABC transporter permease [Deltaproteobacteria bacterium]